MSRSSIVQAVALCGAVAAIGSGARARAAAPEPSGVPAPVGPTGQAGQGGAGRQPTTSSAATLTDGDQPITLPLLPTLTLETYAAPDQPVRATTLAPTWRKEDGGRLSAAMEDPASGAQATFRVDRLPDGAAELTVVVTYPRRTWLGLSALELPMPGPPTVFDRDVDGHPVASVAWIDRFSTKKVLTGQVAVLIDDGVDGVTVRRAAGGRTRLRVELFSTEARPFRYEPKCIGDWHLERPTMILRARVREPGERDVARVELRGGDGAFLAKARYPEGRTAALVITDHADQSSPETFAALARGRSDTAQPVGGLLGHRLVITKSLFWRGAQNGAGRGQLEDPRVRAMAEELATSGSEITPHSVTPRPDDRALTAEGLAAFDHFAPATWIDHQPQTNCEAFTNEGWRGADDPRSSEWRISDLLAQHGYRYIWAGLDVPYLDLLGGDHPEQRALTLWPIGRLAPGDPDDRWLFLTTWMFVDRSQFFHTLGVERLDRLERDHGLAILHTYLESLHTEHDNPRFASRNVLRRGAGGVEVDPRFEEILADLRRRIDRGTLWMPTLRALGDHLRALDQVRVRYAGDGTALVVSPAPVPGMTFRVPGAVDVRIDGHPPLGRREDRGATLFWFDLAAAHETRIAITPRDLAGEAGGRAPTRFFAHARTVEVDVR